MSRATPAQTATPIAGFLRMSLHSPGEALLCLREGAHAVVLRLRGERAALVAWRNAWRMQCTTWNGR